MTETLTEAAISLLLILAVFGPLERAFPARQGQRFFRSQLVTDLGFFAGSYLIFAAMVTFFLQRILLLTEHVLGGASWREETRSWPLWLLVILSLSIGDLVVYWFHRASHRFEILWRFHRVHHTAEHLDWLAAHREHPVDSLLTQAMQNLPGIVLGLPFHAVAGVIVFRGLWAIFIHSNVRLPLGPLRVLLGAPELHHWHHARLERTEHNFANLAPYWDVLFGTYHRAAEPERYPLGIPGSTREPYWRHLVVPLLPSRWLARSAADHEQAGQPGSQVPELLGAKHIG